MQYAAPNYIATVCAAVALAGCVVAPVGMEPDHRGPPGYGGHVHAVPPAVVYVAPTYVMPAPGYVWQHHGRHGWGWHHPHRGWHRGWR